MAKKMEELLEEAKALEIETDGLNYNALRSAIKQKKEALAANGTPNGNGGVRNQSNDQDSPVLEEEPNATVLRHQKLKEKRQKNAKKAAKSEKAKKAKEEEEKALAEKESKKGKKDNRPVFTDDRGLKFRFKKTAPKSINIDGKSVPVSKAIEDKEIMLELVYGNSNFIEQIYS